MTDVTDLDRALALYIGDFAVFERECDHCRCQFVQPVIYVHPRWTKPGWCCYDCVLYLKLFRGAEWTAYLLAWQTAKRIYADRAAWLKQTLEAFQGVEL